MNCANACQLATEIDTSPSFSKRRTKSAKKPVLEAPEWKRILPQSTIPLSHRLMAKKQDPMNYCANLLRVSDLCCDPILMV